MVGKTYQYRLTEAECQLHNFLRKLEAEFEDDFPTIFNGACLPKLDKPLTLALKLGGREIESFDLCGTQLIQDCASVGAKIVRKLLTSEEHEFDRVKPPINGISPLQPVAEDTTKARPAITEEVPVSPAGNELSSWSSVRQQVIPPYVKSVGFWVDRNDIDQGQQEQLKSQFPDVTICTGPPYVHGANFHNDEFTCERDTGGQCLQQIFAADTAPITSPTLATKSRSSMDTDMSTIADSVPVTPSTAATPKPSLLSRMSFEKPEIRIKGVASGNIDDVDVPTGPKSSINGLPKIPHRNPSAILSIAERIGLNIPPPKDKVIHAMWLQWVNFDEIKPWGPRLLSLDRYCDNLVTLYILAYHKKELDLCFAVLARFQNTNYCVKGKLPELSTAVLAFQHLPENDDLCRWLAVLFAFLWGTQQYKNHGELVAELPELDRPALSRLLFAIAYIRDPFTRGHNTAVLDRWCEVHHHEEGDKRKRCARKCTRA
ncbi:hypothetical protein N0V95_003938 [Ascochyta clinopodiicola]|nr:hypothetical protein N0V95_003938 [Ascochyta clinopodiicola]